MKLPIRVLEVLEATVGGTRKHLISILQGIDRKNFHVEVASPKVRYGNVTDTAFYDEIQKLGIPWHEVQMVREVNVVADLKAFVRLNQIIKAGNYDIVHLHSSKAGFLGRLASKLQKVKTVYTPNGFYFLDSKISTKYNFYLFLEQLSGNFTDRLIAVSESEQDIASKNRILPKEKIFLIPNAIDTKLFTADDHARKSVRQELGISSTTPIVGTVSRYISQKDPLTLVKAASLLLSRFPEVRFVWCGEGELRHETEALANSLGVHSAFHFLGFRNDVHRIMNAFDIFVLSSIFEGLPYTILEVMALGIPVVATEVVGNKDVISDRESGLLVPPCSPQHLMQAMSELLVSFELRKSIGDRGRRLVNDTYDVRIMVRNLEKVYQSLV
jgi:glycosyltransferase involved in cell wall biosynthesis